MKPEDLTDRLNADIAYSVRYKCSNCFDIGVLSFAKGNRADSQHRSCPKCGCYGVLRFEGLNPLKL